MRIFSETQKNRLKVAAKLLRKDGARFEEGNFYEAVIAVIEQIDKPKRENLDGLIDWLFAYESAESIYWSVAPLPRARKDKIRTDRKANSSGSRR